MALVADQFQGNSSARRERGQPLAIRSMTSAKYACGLSPLSRADSTIVYMCAQPHTLNCFGDDIQDAYADAINATCVACRTWHVPCGPCSKRRRRLHGSMRT
jgi:hypothetical protein